MDEFPTLITSNITGEIGVNAVSKIVNNELKWIFRRNHNEHDFGIDGYLDIVTELGAVTGQTIAVQIKTGKSFFKIKESKGFVFYGEKKHLNYYINLQTPILIILCDPQDELCYWSLFDINKIDSTLKGWKTIVRKNQIFSINTKQKLLDIVGPPINALKDIEAQWNLNRELKESDYIHCIIDRNDIEADKYQFLIDFFERLQLNDALCKASQGVVELSIHGYDGDDRELWQIPEVINWMKLIEPQIKYWFYFIKTEHPCYWLRTIMLCLCEADWISKPEPYIPANAGQVTANNELIAEFLNRNYCWLNEMTKNLNMNIEENKRITFEVVNALGLENPN